MKASYKYQAEDVDELAFEVGEVINVVEYEDPEDQVHGVLFEKIKLANVFLHFFLISILLIYRRKVGLWDLKKLLDKEECSLLISQDLSKREKCPTNYAIVMRDNNVFSNRSRALPVILFYPSKIAHNNLLFFQTIFW